MFHSFSVHHLAMYVQALILLVLNAERYQYSLWRKDRSSSRRNCSVSCILVTAADRPVCHGCQWHALSCIVKGEDSNRHRPFKAAWVCMTCMSQQCFKRRPRPIGIQALLHNQSLIGPSAVRCSLGSVHQVS
ncbi:hypothetical protein F9C07_1530011 [Aspergillus flavus]|uniref:Uncharacterized protein n=2 Tax=Aspergillus flavus TaxID=5059 RepID=A0A7U2QZN7_ASPFN|nr:hypothetical protein BDV35DRAFT_63336 [Aspergillus flavus]QRD90102.1 hypothetical protein F9C07_1530011 [Aspergillus flavus]